MNVCSAPIASDTGVGVTVTDSSGPGGTVTVAVAEIEPLDTRTVFVNVPATAAAVKSPVLGSIVPPLATTDHAGVKATTLPCASLPTAVNCCVARMATVAGDGVIVIVASGPVVTITDAFGDDRAARRVNRRGERARCVARGERATRVDRTAITDGPEPIRDVDDVAVRVLPDGDEVLRCADDDGDRSRATP